jgi:MFS family permease
MAAAPHPFSFRDFRFLWASRFMMTIGQTSMVVVIGWQVYDIARQTMSTKDAAFQLGLIGLVQFIPLALLTLVTGWTADRVDRRWIARIVILLEAACAGSLAWLSWTGNMSLTPLFVVAGLLGVCRAFAGPAVGAIAPNLVPPESLPTAIAVSSLAWQMGGIGGPALGGYLYAAAPWLPYTISATLFLLAAIGMFMIRPLPRTELDRTANPWRQMVDGLHYVRKNRLVLGAISLDLFAVLLGGATAMLPVYARDILHTGPEGLGHLRAAPAIGATLVGLWFTFKPLKSHVGVKMLASVVVFGVATVGFGLSTNFILSLACLGLLGAADMLSVYVRTALVQIWTPNEMRGRVGAVASLFVSGSNELGEAESGLFAALIGPVAAVVIGGAGAVAVTLLWARLFPELGRAKTFDPPIRTLKEELA